MVPDQDSLEDEAQDSPDYAYFSQIIRRCLAAFLLGYLLGIGRIPEIM